MNNVGPIASESENPRFSFVIPARDEELLLAKTIDSIRESSTSCGITSEIIVVDDASQDQTAEIARANGAHVVSVELHNIGAVRNAGAAIARGEYLLFLDADTALNAKTLSAILGAIQAGAIGGGAGVAIDSRITLFQRFLSFVFLTYWQRFHRWAAGCCIYVRRDVFQKIGGFDEKHFAAEERYLSDAIKSEGKFVIVREPVVTSGRKLRLFSTWHMLKVATNAMLIKRWKLNDRDGLEVLYDAPREKELPHK